MASLLNEKNAKKSDHDTKLDVLSILANVAGSSDEANAVVSNALQAVSEWFDEYIATTEVDPDKSLNCIRPWYSCCVDVGSIS